MDIVLLALIALAIPICGVVGFFMALNLKTRVRELEQRLAGAETRLQGLILRGVPAPDGPAGEDAAVGPTREEPTPAQAPAPAPAALPEPPRPTVPVVAPQAGPVPPQPGLEERLGARWAVWVGGLALGLGGLFLVRYSIEQGLLGPGARIAAGALFALALVAAGEWLRRRETAFSIGEIPSAHIPGVLTAAGTLTAFATVYAAHALYGLIGPAGAFGLLGLIAVLTMVASALHGPALAALGLVGALATPLLVSSDAPQAWPVILYLAFAVAAAYGVARLRLWRWLALAAAAGALLWGLMFAVVMGTAGEAMAHVAIETALAGLFLVADAHRRTPDEAARVDRFATLVLLGFAALSILVAADSEAGAGRPAFAGAMALAMLGLALRFVPVAGAALWAGAIAAGTMLLWPIAREVAAEPPRVLPGPLGQPARPESLVTFLAFGALLAAAIGAGALGRIARGRALRAEIAACLAGAAALAPLAILVVAYTRVTAFDRSIPFALVAAGLAAAFAAAARGFARASEPTPARRLALGATAAASLAALALGLTFALEKGMLTVAFALMALGTAWVADRTALPVLRRAVAATGALVAARLVWDPTIVGGSPGATPILNWLLWGYGVPAVAFFLAARLLQRHGRDRITRFVESLAIAFAAFLVFFEIRHAVRGDIASPLFDHLEAGLVCTEALVFAIVLTRADLARGDPVYRIGSALFSALAVVVAAGGLLIATNPLLTGDPVLGGAVLNSLLAAYLLPAVLAGGLAILARRAGRPPAYVRGAAALALVLHLAWLVMEIRHLFQGPVIDWNRPTGEAEQWCYSLALLTCGLVSLGLAAATGSRTLRVASLAYLAIAVVKVFVVDLSSLEGLMRALSFIGLGLTLIGIALVYQRLLARRPEATGA